MVERFNGTLQQMLSIFVDENSSNWDDHRSTIHESTKFIPNLVMLGRKTNLSIDVVTVTTPTGTHPPEIGCNHSYVEWICNTMEITDGIVHENLQSSFERQKRYHGV